MLLILFLFVLFGSTSNAYDQNIAKHFVNLSQSAYCVTSVNQWDCITCDPSVKLDYIIEKEGSKAIQGFDTYTNSIFIAFRGSSNIHNWIDNIQIDKISPYIDKSIKIEKGFYKEYSHIKNELLDNLPILANKYNTNHLSITGHSAGAAMATIMTYEISNLFSEYDISYLIQFGSPRVGNLEFVQDFNKYNVTSYRITHYHDMVPHVPEELFGYHHISNEIWYNEDNSEYKICDDSNYIEDNSCSNSCAPLHCTSASDHLYYLNVNMGNGEPNCSK